MTIKFNSKKIQIELANWVSREIFYVLNDEVPKDYEIKIKNRLSRKYKIRVDSKELAKKIKHLREIYIFAKKNLRKFILPSEVADPKYVKYDDFLKFLSNKFPREERKILDDVMGWVILWEYLR